MIVESKNINVITRPMNIDLVIHWRNWNGINNEEWYKEYIWIYIYIYEYEYWKLIKVKL